MVLEVFGLFVRYQNDCEEDGPFGRFFLRVFLRAWAHSFVRWSLLLLLICGHYISVRTYFGIVERRSLMILKSIRNSFV